MITTSAVSSTRRRPATSSSWTSAPLIWSRAGPRPGRAAWRRSGGCPAAAAPGASPQKPRQADDLEEQRRLAHQVAVAAAQAIEQRAAARPAVRPSEGARAGAARAAAPASPSRAPARRPSTVEQGRVAPAGRRRTVPWARRAAPSGMRGIGAGGQHRLEHPHQPAAFETKQAQQAAAPPVRTARRGWPDSLTSTVPGEARWGTPGMLASAPASTSRCMPVPRKILPDTRRERLGSGWRESIVLAVDQKSIGGRRDHPGARARSCSRPRAARDRPGPPALRRRGSVANTAT